MFTFAEIILVYIEVSIHDVANFTAISQDNLGQPVVSSIFFLQLFRKRAQYIIKYNIFALNYLICSISVFGISLIMNFFLCVAVVITEYVLCIYRLVLRILPPITDKCIIPFHEKFGCHPKHVPRLLNVAKELNLNAVGVR